MICKSIPVTAAALLLPLATLLTGCEESADQAAVQTVDPQPTVVTPAPQRTVELVAVDRAQVDALITSYHDLREQLSSDQAEGLAESFTAVREAAQPLADSEEPDIRRLAQSVVDRAAAEPADLKQARAEFGGLSESMIELTKAAAESDAVPQTLYVAYCPMAKASWLQATEELQNPYMGQKMPKCGEVKETIAAK